MSTSAGRRASSNARGRAPRAAASKAASKAPAPRAPRGAKAQYEAALIAYHAAQNPGERRAAAQAVIRAGAALEDKRFPLLQKQLFNAEIRLRNIEAEPRTGLTARQLRSQNNRYATAVRRATDLRERVQQSQDRARYYRALAAGRPPRVSRPTGFVNIPTPQPAPAQRARGGRGRGAQRGGGVDLMRLLEITVSEMEQGMARK